MSHSEENYLRGYCQLRNSLTTAILTQELGEVFFNQGVFDILVLDALYNDRIEEQYRTRKQLRQMRKRTLTLGYTGNPLLWLAKQGRYCLY